MIGTDVEDDGSLSLTIIWYTDSASKSVTAANRRKYSFFRYITLLVSFYRAMLCMRGTSHGSLCPCLSVSVTCRSSTKTAKHRTTQTKPHNSSGSLVFDTEDLCEIRPGSPPMGTPNAGGVGQNRRISTNSWLYLETVQHIRMVSSKVE